MKSLLTKEQKEKEQQYMKYKKLIRSLRRGKVEKINSKKNNDSIAEK